LSSVSRIEPEAESYKSERKRIEASSYHGPTPTEQQVQAQQAQFQTIQTKVTVLQDVLNQQMPVITGQQAQIQQKQATLESELLDVQKAEEQLKAYEKYKDTGVPQDEWSSYQSALSNLKTQYAEYKHAYFEYKASVDVYNILVKTSPYPELQRTYPEYQKEYVYTSSMVEDYNQWVTRWNTVVPIINTLNRGEAIIESAKQKLTALENEPMWQQRLNSLNLITPQWLKDYESMFEQPIQNIRGYLTPRQQNMNLVMNTAPSFLRPASKTIYSSFLGFPQDFQTIPQRATAGFFETLTYTVRPVAWMQTGIGVANLIADSDYRSYALEQAKQIPNLAEMGGSLVGGYVAGKLISYIPEGAEEIRFPKVPEGIFQNPEKIQFDAYWTEGTVITTGDVADEIRFSQEIFGNTARWKISDTFPFSENALILPESEYGEIVKDWYNKPVMEFRPGEYIWSRPKWVEVTYPKEEYINPQSISDWASSHYLGGTLKGTYGKPETFDLEMGGKWGGTVENYGNLSEWARSFGDTYQLAVQQARTDTLTQIFGETSTPKTYLKVAPEVLALMRISGGTSFGSFTSQQNMSYPSMMQRWTGKPYPFPQISQASYEEEPTYLPDSLWNIPISLLRKTEQPLYSPQYQELSMKQILNQGSLLSQKQSISQTQKLEITPNIIPDSILKVTPREISIITPKTIPMTIPQITPRQIPLAIPKVTPLLGLNQKVSLKPQIPQIFRQYNKKHRAKRRPKNPFLGGWFGRKWPSAVDPEDLLGLRSRRRRSSRKAKGRRRR